MTFPLSQTSRMWHCLGNPDDVPAGTGREFTVGDRIVAVFHTAEGFRALDGICPHAGGPLGDGQLNGDIVTCPWHGWQFNVQTGRHCLTARIQQASYPVRIENSLLEVELP